MIKNTKYYSLIEGEDELTLSSQMAINWIEVIAFPIPFFVVLVFVGGIVPAFIVAPLVLIIYVLFRYTASIYYKEFVINIANNEFLSKQLLFGKVRHLEQIDKKMQFEKFQFVEMKSGGQTKYLLRYHNHKNFDLLIIRSLDDKIEIEKFLKKDNRLQQ